MTSAQHFLSKAPGGAACPRGRAIRSHPAPDSESHTSMETPRGMESVRMVERGAGTRQAERDALVAGLRATPATIPPKHFYDSRGSELFDAICELPEYYPTRTETAILRDRDEIAGAAGRGGQFVELGAGASLRRWVLLDLDGPSGTWPLTSPATWCAGGRRWRRVPGPRGERHRRRLRARPRPAGDLTRAP